MQSMAVCPLCRRLLVPDEANSSVLRCAPCQGEFVRPAEDFEVQALPRPGDLVVAGETLSCPHCLSDMMVFDEMDDPYHQCVQCGGVWRDVGTISGIEIDDEPAIAVAEQSDAVADRNLLDHLLYGVSLPERLMRSLIGVAAGTSREAASLLVPPAFQSSKAYEVAIRNSLDFLTETVGGMRSTATPESSTEAAGEHIARKAVGNFIDLTSMATLHFSPLWVLAAVSDVAYGTSTYVKELAKELEREGLIDSASTIHNIDDVLEALRNTTGNVASNLDRPPVSLKDLTAVIQETRTLAGEADLTKLFPKSEIQAYWSSLHTVAAQENVSLITAATGVAMYTANQSAAIARGGVTGFRVAGSLIDRNVFEHYRDALKEIRDHGLLAMIRQTYEPYAAQMWDNFAEDRKSWTESLLDPRTLSKFVAWPKFFGGGETEKSV
ncbi:MAG: hypothetical protein KDA80_09585 [Planctomycetaceae bacterium]|nr:hypothetical protein [Planctomycetaceae bacterium]